jgi:hypothetical protein
MSNKIICTKCKGIRNPCIFTAPEMWCICGDNDVRGGHDCMHTGMDGLDVCLICHEPLKKQTP